MLPELANRVPDRVPHATSAVCLCQFSPCTRSLLVRGSPVRRELCYRGGRKLVGRTAEIRLDGGGFSARVGGGSLCTYVQAATREHRYVEGSSRGIRSETFEILQLDFFSIRLMFCRRREVIRGLLYCCTVH